MQVDVLSVYDEGALEDTPFIGAKGISILIEMNGERILFDTGMRGRYLIRNLECSDIPCDSIDKVVISHNHKSNVNGLGKLLDERTKPLDVYVNSLFSQRKALFGRKIYSDEQSSKLIVHEMTGDTEINDYITAIGPFGEAEEYFLILRTRSGPVVFSSCYHCGTACVLDRVKELTGKEPFCLIGGIHVPKVNQKGMDPTAQIFKDHGTPRMYLNHCATPNGVLFLRTHFGLDGVKNFYVGTKLKFEA